MVGEPGSLPREPPGKVTGLQGTLPAQPLGGIPSWRWLPAGWLRLRPPGAPRGSPARGCGRPGARRLPRRVCACGPAAWRSRGVADRRLAPATGGLHPGPGLRDACWATAAPPASLCARQRCHPGAPSVDAEQALLTTPPGSRNLVPRLLELSTSYQVLDCSYFHLTPQFSLSPAFQVTLQLESLLVPEG